MGEGWHRTSFALLIASIVTSEPAVAIPPPLPPSSHYGPVRFCADHSRFDVTADEAVSWTDYGATAAVTLVTLDYSVTVERFGEGLRAALPYRNFVRGRTTRIALADGHTADRFVIVDGNGDRSTGYVRQVADAGDLPLLFVSAQFDGGERDLALLRRFTVGTPDALNCAGQTWRDPAFTAGNDDRASFVSRSTVQGPALICGSGLAFALLAGETAPLYWPRGRSRGLISEVAGEDRYFNVSWPSVLPRARVTATTIGGRDLPIHVSRSDGDGGNRAYTIKPREGREGQNVTHFGIGIAGRGTEADDLAVLRRFESVAPDDRRCFRPSGDLGR